MKQGFIFNKQHTQNKSKRIFWTGLIGNSLDHYDSAAYAFLAPFLAPIFFPESDPVVALILAYGIKSFGLFTRPMGAIIFGHLALKYPIKKLLYITLSGVAISTFLIGLIPSYETIGIFAPLLLVIIRSIQGIFASGEHNIAALFVLEHVKDRKKHGRASSYYLCSTMTGTLLASLAATIVAYSPDPTFYWRIAFLLGIITGIAGIYFRSKSTINESPKVTHRIKPKHSFKLLIKNKWKLVKIIPMSSFVFITYIVPFIFLNNFIPLLTTITTTELLVHNTALLVIDILMIPIAGILSDMFNPIKWMAVMSSLMAITIVPIFYLLPHLDIVGITIIKIWIIIIGVCFVAPFNAMLFRMIGGREKYLITGFGYAIGTELLGKSTTAICLALWYFSANPVAPALYIAFVSFCATIALFSEVKNHQN